MTRLATYVLLFSLLPAVALAQLSTVPGTTSTTSVGTPGTTQTIDEIRQTYHLRAGPLYINPALLLKEFGVDTNVFNEGNGEDSDFTFTLTPQAEVALPVARRALIRTELGADLVYYKRYESERSVDPQVKARAEVFTTRLTFSAAGAHLNTRQRPNYEIDLRSRHQEDDLSVGVGLRVSSKLTLESSALMGKVRYDGDAVYYNQEIQQTLNRDSKGFSVALRDRLTSLTSVAVRYERRFDRFPLMESRNTDSFRVMPGIEFKPRALIRGMAYVGYRDFTPRNPLIPPYRGVVAQVGLTYTLLGATTFGVTYDRDPNYSFEVVNPYYLDNSVGLTVRRQIAGRFDAIANVARHRYSYRSIAETVDPVQEPFTPRTDITDNYGANVGYRLRRDMRVGFGFSYYTRTSTLPGVRDYDGLRVGMMVTYGL